MSERRVLDSAQAEQPSYQQQQPAANPTEENDALATKLKRKLPPYLDHFNARDLKVFFRCWVAAWVACLLVFITPSLRSLGFGAFFAW